MALFKRGALLLAATLILAACTRDGGISSYLAGGCTNAYSKRFKGIDWNKVRHVEIRIRQDEYSPMVISLTQGQPYIMSIKNDDDGNHNFRATEFFQSVAMARATVGDEVFKNGCIDAVSLEPGQTAELRFIAVRDGRYDFEDNSLLFAFSSFGGASGSISVQPKLVVYTPPVRIPNKKPAAKPAPVKPPSGGLFGTPPPESAPEAQPKTEVTPAPPGGGEPSTKLPSAPTEPVEKSGTIQPPVANSAKPNNDIFGEPIETEPIGPEPDKGKSSPPVPPNDDIFAAPLQQSMS